MKTSEFAQCVKIARDYSVDLSAEDISAFWLCGLPEFKPIFVTARQVAKFVRYQSAYLSGGFDPEAIAECAEIARKRFFLT